MRGVQKKYIIIANPVAGRGKGLRVFQTVNKIFQSRRLDFTTFITEKPGDAARIAAEHAGFFDVTVSVGGDGTLNEIINGIRSSGKTLGVIPAGSGNDFAKSLNLPKNLNDIVSILQNSQVLTADAGRFNDIYFINGVGIGFDAAVNHATKKIPRLNGFALYLWAMLRTLASYKPIPLKIIMNGTSVEKKTFLVAIGNGSFCGGGFRLTPSAKINDHLLDINVLDPVSIPVLLWHLPKVFQGTIAKTRYATINRTAGIEIESQSPFPVHIDGEPHIMDSGRHVIEVLPSTFNVIGNVPDKQ